ncbi:TraG-like protein, N-terminal region [Klebsiella pneumoniae]|nr:TraG-like protein, N-terminal region [Klebsiella pneumoniae]SVT91390.1 TraG-like protein, N-terminal region [Klebsiella pneumoniae]
MLSFVQFALFFLTFWWELARWLMQILYDSDTHSWANLNGLQNTSDDLIVNIIMGVMFLVLPVFWHGALASQIACSSGQKRNPSSRIKARMIPRCTVALSTRR